MQTLTDREPSVLALRCRQLFAFLEVLLEVTWWGSLHQPLAWLFSAMKTAAPLVAKSLGMFAIEHHFGVLKI